MTTWDDLDTELTLWEKAEKEVTFWWRDDDAIEPTEALNKLLSICETHKAPCAIAVVPHLAKPSLADLLNKNPMAFPVQHGFQHINHAPKGEKAAEFGNHRDRAKIEQELHDGQQALATFKQLSPVFVPPWNRMTDDLNAYMAEIGFQGVSQHAPRKAEIAKGGLRQVNTHVDIIDWRTTRGFVGDAKALGYVVSHLQDRRLGNVDAEEPTGVLTHHLDHDQGCWVFMNALLHWTLAKSYVRWLSPLEAFKI